MGSEHIEHVPLIIGLEEKKAVPTENPVKLTMKRDCSHVGHYPLLIRQTLATERDERRRGIDAGHTKSVLHEMASDRHC